VGFFAGFFVCGDFGAFAGDVFGRGERLRYAALRVNNGKDERSNY